MKLEKVIFQKFTANAIRLFNNIQIIAEQYIYDEIPQYDFVRLVGIEMKTPEFTEDVLKNDAVLTQTVIILTLMEASDNKKQFENLHKKRKKRISDPVEAKKEAEGFDKILKGIMKVPKPDKK